MAPLGDQPRGERHISLSVTDIAPGRQCGSESLFQLDAAMKIRVGGQERNAVEPF
jgi:hypothetical protein